MLKEIARRLTEIAGEPTGVGRISGDEFAVIVAGHPTKSLRQVADDIRNAVATPIDVDGVSIIISGTVGAALYPVNAETGEMLFRAAADALSAAKAHGRNALAFFDTEMKERMERNESLEQDLRQALPGQERRPAHLALLRPEDG